MKNFVQPGNYLDYTIPADTTIVAGEAVVIGGLVGVAASGGTTGTKISVSLTGVYNLAKVAGAITQGALVYWKADTKQVTTTSSGNTLMGKAAKAALSADPTVDVLLSN